jgi:hypothetical protein
MPVTDRSGNGIVDNVGGAVRPGYSLWAANANGDGTAVPWEGGAGTVVVSLIGTGATMGGGTISIKSKFIGKVAVNGLSFVTVDNSDQLAITAPGTYDFRMASCDLVASLAGATNPVGVCVSVSGYDQ